MASFRRAVLLSDLATPRNPASPLVAIRSMWVSLLDVADLLQIAGNP